MRRVGCRGLGRGKVFHGRRHQEKVALTFDDGPGPYTRDVLKILSSHHVRATFFEIGEQVPSFPGKVRRILAAGHEIGNHSLHHESGPGQASLSETQDLIEAATGYEPCMFRPPGGYEPSSTAAAADALGLVSVIWDVDTRDWETPGADAIFARATAVQPGSIVLMHDGGGDRSQTVEALPRIIENLKSRGYRLVTLTRLLGGRYRYAEDHGRHDPKLSLPDPMPFPRHREGP